MIHDAFEKGVEWLNSLIEMIRRTPVLGLIANTAMRVITMMTPNFWMEMSGTGVGFVIPEVIIWLIGLLIGALASSSGVGAAPAAAALAARAATTAKKVRTLLVQGAGRTIAAIKQFMDMLQPIIEQIGPLGRKLNESIVEGAEGFKNEIIKLFRPTRYWRKKLDELASQRHGPQRHEGDVTDGMLWDRAYKGIDMMTGTTVDYDKFLKKYGVVYDPKIHGTEPKIVYINAPGKGRLQINWNKVRHRSGEHATKFNTPADYVRAYEAVIKSPEYKSFLNDTSKGRVLIEDLRMSDVFGPDFQARVRGYSVIGGKDNPRIHTGTPFAETVFDNNTEIVAIFERDANGIPQLQTMYPNP